MTGPLLVFIFSIRTIQVPNVRRDAVAVAGDGGGGGKDWDKAIQLFRRTVIEKFLQVGGKK